MHENSSPTPRRRKAAQRITQWIPALLSIVACLPVGCASVADPSSPWFTFTLVGQSANVHANQGYASGISPTNGPLNYFFASRTLTLSSTYNTLTVETSNNDFLIPGTNHMGAGDVFDGTVYAVIEHWSHCGVSLSPIVIVLFDGESLNVEKTIDISRDLPEASGIAIVPDQGEAIVTSFCDATHLYVYDMSNWTLRGKIPLAIPVGGIQGAAYRDGILYIAKTDGALYGLRLFDNSMRLLYQSPMKGEFEGLDFHTDQLRWLVNKPGGEHILYSYAPNVG